MFLPCIDANITTAPAGNQLQPCNCLSALSSVSRVNLNDY